MSVYRVAAEREPEPKRSWWCRLGLHRWLFWDFGYVGHIIDRCSRPPCDASRVVEL